MLVVPLLGFTFIDVASIYALATSMASSLSVLAIFITAFRKYFIKEVGIKQPA
ncbi:TPA: hypothetical protein I0H43_RS11255 [Enterococcus faecalis]|nr:hypothetical protein [Enterococcus faecalis]